MVSLVVRVTSLNRHCSPLFIDSGYSSRYKLLCKLRRAPQWGAADAEIKVPSVENMELKGSPFKAWSRSVCSHTCYADCQEISSLLISTLPVRSLAFSPKKLSRVFSVLVVTYTGSCVGPQNKIGHQAGCRFPW